MAADANSTDRVVATTAHLIVAMELLRSKLDPSAAFMLANAGRDPDEGFGADSRGMPHGIGDRPAFDASRDVRPGDADSRVVVVDYQGRTVPVHVVGGLVEHEAEQAKRAAEIQLNPRSVPRERPRGPAGKPKGRGVGEQIASLLTSKFAMVMGPLVALTSVLQAATSGFNVFNGAVRVLAATLAPILLPVFVLLAAALVAVSDAVWDRLLPVLDDWYKWILETGIPAVQKLVDAFGEATDGILKWVEYVRHPEKLIADLKNDPAGVAKATDDATDPFGMMRSDGILPTLLGKAIDSTRGTLLDAPVIGPLSGINFIRDQFRGKSAGNAAAGAPLPSGAAGSSATPPGDADRAATWGRSAIDRVNAAVAKMAPARGAGGALDTHGDVKAARDLVMKELRRSMGPQAAFHSLAGASQAAQLGAINQSPFEQIMLQRMQQALDKLDRVGANTAPKLTGMYGPGGGN